MNRKNYLWLAFALNAFFYLPVSVTAQGSKKPVMVIYDTDMDLDVDDAGALAILHAMANNSEAKILGVICNSPTPYAATTVSAINMYYGHPEIPIGDMPMDDYVYDTSFSRRYRNYVATTPFGNFNLPIFKRFDITNEPLTYTWRSVQNPEPAHILLKQAASDETFEKRIEDLMVLLPKDSARVNK